MSTYYKKIKIGTSMNLYLDLNIAHFSPEIFVHCCGSRRLKKPIAQIPSSECRNGRCLTSCFVIPTQ